VVQMFNEQRSAKIHKQVVPWLDGAQRQDYRVVCLVPHEADDAVTVSANMLIQY
jgi:hypothetical protein